VSRLESDPDEVILLFRDLLIRVTSFFRDQETFEALQATVVPRLFDNKNADGTVRIWVPGCATGEEAYSLAILLREHMDSLRGVPKVQIFATDIDEAAISTARVGCYPATLLEGLSSERRERFFRASQGTFVVSKDIRELCTFSMHNLVSDRPFSRMDLVSCRNLLIYMDGALQDAVLPLFHYSLVPRGLLLLGGAETAARHESLFETLDKTHRIFRRRDARSPPLNLQFYRPALAPPVPFSHAEQMRLLKRGGILPPAGGAQVEKFAVESGASAEPSNPPPSERSGFFRRIAPNATRLHKVEQRLVGTQEELQSLREEHQTALEELRSTNEELHSVNEEMQSANEELETSKEELQSLNEELQTVNLRLTEKVNELNQSNNDLRNLFESTEIATVFLDRHLIIRSFTPAIATLYNLIPSDAGRPLTDIVSRLGYERIREDVAQVLETLEPLERQVASVDHSAHYVMRILPYREPDSTVSGALVTFVDVTNIVRAEMALRDADVRKDLFLATLSHELRNPLAPIRTAAHILQSSDLAPQTLARAQQIISRQVTHMSSLLDDLLDVSRITRGAVALKKQYVDLEALMGAAVEEVEPTIHAKGHTLSLQLEAKALIIEADPVRLTQVLSNLLTNAAKYTEPGGLITLGSRLEAHALLLYVRDSGIGLTARALKEVFDMFTRVSADTDRSEGGLGIGLSLARGLVELHGGQIEARSLGLGQGSEFIISLPREIVVDNPAQIAEPLDGASNSRQRSVLIADDNKDAAETLGMFLGLAGHVVHVVHSGTQTLETAESVRPEVIVLDIGMPDLNGYQVAEKIRAEAWGANVKLIAVTGWGQDEDKRAALAAGFDHHLTKPIDPQQLERLFMLPGS
jgi:two-component system CheB/CheR fusion protein